MNIPEIKNYKEWLKSLKVGQNIAVEMFSEGENPKYAVREILEINEEYIKVKGFNKFRDGMITAFKGHITRICPVTPDALDFTDRKFLLKQLYQLDVRRLSTEKLRKIYAVINE